MSIVERLIRLLRKISDSEYEELEDQLRLWEIKYEI